MENPASTAEVAEPGENRAATGSSVNLARPAPGWKTTEFWLSVFVIILLALGEILEVLPAKMAASLSSGIAVAWTIIRTIYKIQHAALGLDLSEEFLKSGVAQLAARQAHKEAE